MKTKSWNSYAREPVEMIPKEQLFYLNQMKHHKGVRCFIQLTEASKRDQKAMQKWLKGTTVCHKAIEENGTCSLHGTCMFSFLQSTDYQVGPTLLLHPPSPEYSLVLIFTPPALIDWNFFFTKRFHGISYNIGLQWVLLWTQEPWHPSCFWPATSGVSGSLHIEPLCIQQVRPCQKFLHEYTTYYKYMNNVACIQPGVTLPRLCHTIIFLSQQLKYFFLFLCSLYLWVEKTELPEWTVELLLANCPCPVAPLKFPDVTEKIRSERWKDGTRLGSSTKLAGLS